MKKVAILQSNYIPWKGYFDIISRVDTFIFHDDLQFTKGDWRNRNKIKTENGLKWLTIPCGTSENRLICEVILNDHSWQKKHWSMIEAAYKSAPFFNMYKDYFKEFYLGRTWTNLSELNQSMIKGISRDILNLDTQFEDSRTYHLEQKKGERVLELLTKSKAEVYISGPAAKDYLEPDEFKKTQIGLEYIVYDYAEYQQLYGAFNHFVSVLDVLFNCGEAFPSYIFGNKSEVVYSLG
ncbi:hypothetical protein EP331_12120 [bacterium]|nr:MAG: hypothetical protein EP331_12120 [bacterium]